MTTVVFACIQNAGRSQMAAAFFNALADPAHARALSAGTEPAVSVLPEVVEAMREVGIDLSAVWPRRLTPAFAAQATVLVTMGCGEACPVVPGVQREDWKVADPKDQPLERVRSIRDEIRERVQRLVAAQGWQPRPHGSRPSCSRTLTTSEAKAFYDLFGAKQDTQAFYEDRALDALIAHSDLEHAHAVFEFGCGTGRLAARLLATILPEDCRYLGVDISETMVGLARQRLRPWAHRAEVVLSEGSIPSHNETGVYDRFVSTFVLDLMSDDAIQAVLAGAHRLLGQEGRLCVVSLTHGQGPAAKIVSSAWALLHRLNPKLVGGCRAIDLRDYLAEARWRIHHQEVVSPWWLSSEVVIASPAHR